MAWHFDEITIQGFFYIYYISRKSPHCEFGYKAQYVQAYKCDDGNEVHTRSSFAFKYDLISCKNLIWDLACENYGLVVV